MVKLIVAHIPKQTVCRFDLFHLDLADMATLVDWSSKDEDSVFTQIMSISSSLEALDHNLFLNKKDFTYEGLRNYVQSYIKDKLNIKNPQDYYYVDLVHWNQRPPRKLTSEFNLVSLFEVKVEGTIKVDIFISSLVPYKDVGTRELGALQEKLGMKEVKFFDSVYYKGGDSIAFIKKAIESKTKLYGFKSPPVLVYDKKNEAGLRRALRGTDLYDELFH